MNTTARKSTRLHYLDWLQVIAVLGVFLFHAVQPFDSLVEWNIKNEERSVLATLFSVFFTPWGMPFFFTMAGITSGFSLRRRTAGRYVRERITQLLVPFFIGAIVLTPILAYYELTHRGWWGGGSIIKFILSAEARAYFFTEFHPIVFSPEIFAQLGYHLWFVGFLFVFALIALPLFLWLRQDSGKRLVASLARLAEWRGGLLAFVLPLIPIRFFLYPLFPEYTGWSDFFFMLVFYVAGYILIADERFMRSVRRDGLLYLILGIACTLFLYSVVVGVPVLTWMGSPGTPGFYVSWAVLCVNAWCWTMVMFNVGMRFLDFDSKWLRYSREASFAFFWVHYPVNFFLAFYVVQWNAGILVKFVAVAVGSFAVSLGLYELLVRRISPVRALFGMKPRKA
jgi:peptidoglycan/LPS O-acetylase OafA/YrhL